MVIGDLGDHPWLPVLARWHYDQWGLLTGASTYEDYIALLTEAAASRRVPRVSCPSRTESCSAPRIS